jgi:hypothetical protein
MGSDMAGAGPPSVEPRRSQKGFSEFAGTY